MNRMILIALFMITGACATQSGNTPVSAPEQPLASTSYEEAYAAAVAAIEYSAERGHEWSTARVLLEQASAAAAEGDEENAIELADRARNQAELAAKQADIEEDIWQERVLSAE